VEAQTRLPRYRMAGDEWETSHSRLVKGRC
jgi:hypothetical protein